MIQTTESIDFGRLITGHSPFAIPKYQRAYAWDEDEVEEYLDDIKRLYRDRINSSESRMPHFFGGLVSVRRFVPGTPHGYIHDVVDGQQRLTTFMITVCAILEGLKAIEQEAASDGDTDATDDAKIEREKTETNYFFYLEGVGRKTQQRLRLSLSKADGMYFEQLIRNIGNARTRSTFERDSHRRLQSAWKQIFKDLVELPILNDPSLTYGEKIDRLLQLRSSMTEDCYIIHIVSDNHQEAYRLFSILNDRGKTLSAGDLLRSYTLENLEHFPGHQDQVGEAWDKMLGYTEVQIDEFLRAYYPSNKGSRAPRKDLATTYRDTFFKCPRTLASDNQSDADVIRDGVLVMQKESEVFYSIVEGTWPYASPSVSAWDMGRLNKLIKVLKHTICIPLLLSAYHHLSEQEFSRMVSLIERFSFRYITIVGAHAGRLGDLYNKQAEKIRVNPTGYSLTNFRSNLQALQTSNARDSTFANALTDKLIYRTPSMRQVIRYFLSTIEDYYQWYSQGMSGDPTPDKTRVFDLNSLTIEHVYPQNPAPGESISELEPHKHAIGNLSFWSTSDNQAASNSPFAVKRPLYHGSSVALNRELSTLPTWDLSELNTRRDRLVSIAKEVFKA